MNDEFGFNLNETEAKLLSELDRSEQLRDLGVAMFKVVDLIMPALIAFGERGTGISPDELRILVDTALAFMDSAIEDFDAKHPGVEGTI